MDAKHPTKPHHFLTNKTRAMIALFFLVCLFAVGSYLYLLNKEKSSEQHRSSAGTESRTSPQTLKNPKEYTDTIISLFYPDSLVLDESSTSGTVWNTEVSGTIITSNAMQLRQQATPFSEPTNTSHAATFAIDDKQIREINGIEVVEYTVNCGLNCSYRLDQFQIGQIYYQLYFDVAGSGQSLQAEQILGTLRKIPTPSSSIPSPQEQGICTLEAKMCPDGSAVGRQGPKCEFTACPN